MLHRLYQQLLGFLLSIVQLFDFAVRTPIRWILDRSRSRGSHRSLLVSVLMFPIDIVTGLTTLIFTGTESPVLNLGRALRSRSKDALKAIPSLVAIGFAVFVVVNAFNSKGKIENRYRKKAQQAVAGEDLQKAKVYLTRLINGSEEPTPNDRFSYAKVLTQAGETARAASILNRLAPLDTIGYGPAHKFMALSMAQAISQSNDPEKLKNLRWHLDHTQDRDSQEINQVWAMYYMEVQQPQIAVEHMKRAAELNPSLLLTAGDIHARYGQNSAAKVIYEKAQREYAKSLQNNPLDLGTRVLLAKTHVKLDQPEAAERTLLEGNNLSATKAYKRAVAEFYVLQHDISVRDGGNFANEFRFLREAIRFDVDFVGSYERLIRKYRDAASDPESMAEIRSTLEKLIATGTSTSLGHFALGNIYWIDDEFEQAEWHLQQAYRLDDKLAVVANNLAWLMAHKDDSGLAQAHSLINSVLEKYPEDPRFRDTLGTILMKQGAFEEALVELETALPAISNKKAVHEKLAQIYEKLNKPKMAQLHSRLSGNPEG